MSFHLATPLAKLDRDANYTDRTKLEIISQLKKLRSSILHQVSANPS